MNKYQHDYGTMSSTADVQFDGSNVNSEFNSLCDNIVTNIYTINSSWKTLDNALKSLGTSRDNRGLRDKIHVTQLSTNQIISITPRDLNKLKMIVGKGDKQKELQMSKLTENFTEAVAKYHTLQKKIADTMKANLLISTNIEDSGSETPKLQQQQMQLSRDLAFEQDLLVDREARIKQIEGDVLDINQIMRELSALVHIQGEHIDTIENSIDHAVGHVEGGASELMKAAEYQNKYRRKLCFLVILAAVIVSVLIAILVTVLKKK